MRYVFKKPIYKISILLFDVLGSLVFFSIKLFKNPPSNPKSILIVRLDHIGDFVCTTPLFKNIKKRFPNAKITVLINSVSRELAYRDPNIDKVITCSSPYLARGDKTSTRKGLFRVIKDVRNIGFDLGIDPRGDLLSILIMWLGGVKYRIGYGITGGGFLLHKECDYNRNIHVIDRNLALLEALNIPVFGRSPEVYFSEKDKAEVERLVGNKGASPIRHKIDTLGQAPCLDALNQTPFFSAVVLHPFAGAVSRGWDERKLQDLIDRLKASGFTVFIIGTKDDNCNYKNIIDMRGKFNLPQLAYFIKYIGCFIGLNSGPANIAAALEVPSIIISSGTNIIEHWIPESNNVRFIYQKDIACRPCERKICPKDRYGCMDGITVEEVLCKLKEIHESVF